MKTAPGGVLKAMFLGIEVHFALAVIGFGASGAQPWARLADVLGLFLAALWWSTSCNYLRFYGPSFCFLNFDVFFGFFLFLVCFHGLILGHYS
jgi:hypothetical protein